MRRTQTFPVVVMTCLTAWLAAPLVARAQGGPMIALNVTGPDANPGKLERCLRVAQRMGYQVNPGAPVRVQLILQPGANRLQINSARRGEVFNQVRPPWGMEDLCRDAVRQAQVAISQEGQPPIAPPQQYVPPPPAYGQPPPPPPGYAQPPPPAYVPGGPPTIALDVVGPQANPDKFGRCLRVAQRNGVVVHPGAPLRVQLILQSGMNRLQINSARRGEVLNAPRPPWGMEQLCEDAVRAAREQWAQEGSAPPPQYGTRIPAPPPARPAPPPAAPPPAAMALGPIPPGNDLPPAARAAADRAVGAWQAARFDVALAAFREAERMHPDPQFFFDQAVCEQRLGQYRQGLAHTQVFLDRAPQSPYRPYADQLLAELTAALGE